MEICKISEQTKKKASTKSYASKVFQQSSVGLVSSLAHTSSTPRRIYKIVTLILCLAGFLYQSGKFLSVVFQYPTTVGVDILRPDVLNVPAFTFCDNNGLNRRIYCEMHPNNCEEPNDAFCEKYFGYCGVNKTLVPKRNYYFLNSYMTLEDMIQFNVKLDDFVRDTIFQSPAIEENITGPNLRMRENYDTSLMCYSLYDRINNSLDALQVKQNKIVREPVIKMTFNVRVDEMFLPGKQPGILFAVHNPFEAVNPFEIGIFMKPRRTYMIFVNLEEEVMLEEPYDTKCVNYTEMWEKNGRTGPRMQEMCRQKCLAEIAETCYECIPPDFYSVENEKYCTIDEIMSRSNCDSIIEDRLNECPLKCRDDCSRTKFSYTVQERFKIHFDKNGTQMEDLENTIGVEVYLEADEIVVIKHSPKYMIVEIFSSIGGFIGCWLGVNLLDITDIVEGFFRIIRYSFKRR